MNQEGDNKMRRTAHCLRVYMMSILTDSAAPDAARPKGADERAAQARQDAVASIEARPLLGVGQVAGLVTEVVLASESTHHALV